MTPAKAKEILPIIQAYSEGKVIQYRFPEWVDVHGINFDCLHRYPDRYRVKPEPRRFTVLVPRKEHPRYASAGPMVIHPAAPYDEACWEEVEVVEVLNV